MLQIQRNFNKEDSDEVSEASEAGGQTTSSTPNWANAVKKNLVDPPNPNWVWEVDGYAIDYEVLYSKAATADIAYPTCSETHGPFPAVVIMPGRGNKKIRHKYWSIMFATHGVVGMSVDVIKGENTIKDARTFLQDTYVYPVDKTKIHLVGYSAGATSVLGQAVNPLFAHKFETFTVAAGINPKLLQDHYSDTKPILLIQAQNDQMYGRAAEWGVVSGWAADQIHADSGNTKFLAFKDGTHQPMQQTSFFYEVLRFITDPKNYTPPNDDGIFSSGSFSANQVTAISSEKGCYTNSEGIEPIVTLNLWSGNTGLANCLGACKQVKGCVAFDFLKKNAPDGMNCVLFDKACTTPMQDDGESWTWEGYDGPFNPATCNTDPI